jgi:hypothetical protein
MSILTKDLVSLAKQDEVLDCLLNKKLSYRETERRTGVRHETCKRVLTKYRLENRSATAMSPPGTR